ncbi:GMC oxidoreductase-domain-containing protein, partial [Infundibulicybe gibba]
DDQLMATVAAVNLSGPVIPDLNSMAGENVVGVTNPSYTIDGNHNRSSVRERLLAVQQSSVGKLTFSFDTLATKVLLCNSTTGVKAYGIQVAPGAALAVASNFKGKTTLVTKNYTVRHEVIVSAGTFQSPQLVRDFLSGIGQSAQLTKFGITPVVNLPGVGNNLQDHDEVGIMWRMKQNFTLYNGCTFLSDPKKDPCLQTWMSSNHSNLYSFGPALKVSTSKSPSNPVQPDILTYFTSSFFHGFFAGPRAWIFHSVNVSHILPYRICSNTCGKPQYLLGCGPENTSVVKRDSYIDWVSPPRLR